MLLDNEDVVRGVPVGEERVLVELADEIEEPSNDVDRKLPKDMI